MLIGSIIDVFLAGYRILTVRFYQNFDQIDQKSHPTSIGSGLKPLNLIQK